MKKLTLALLVGMMYLGTQATVVFAQKPEPDSPIGERKACPTCGAVTNNVDSKQPEASGPSNKKKKNGSASNQSSANSAHGGGNK